MFNAIEHRGRCLKTTRQALAAIFLTLILFNSSPGSAYGIIYAYETVDGSIVQYSSHQGRPLLVDAFATWCKPCETEILHIRDVYLSVNEQIDVLSISISPSTDTADKIIEFKDRFEAEWVFGIDYDELLAYQYNVYPLPALLLFDEDGKLVQKWNGITEPSVVYDSLQNEFNITGELADNSGSVYLQELTSNPFFQITGGVLAIILLYIIASNLRPKKPV